MFGLDTATFLADYGDAATWTPSAGGAVVSATVILDQPEDVIEGGEVQSRQYVATFATAEWPGLKRGEVLVIAGSGGGASYRLRADPRTVDDGVFSTASLSKV